MHDRIAKYIANGCLILLAIVLIIFLLALYEGWL